MPKNIFIAASPNTEKDDVALAWKVYFQPWSWRSKTPVEQLEKAAGNYLDRSQAVAFDSARSSLYALLKAYGIGAGDEVILPAFTCLVVANPVVWAGAKPVYVDVSSGSFRYDLRDLKLKINNHTKAIIVQHSFGIVDNLAKIKALAGSRIKIIEDLAHSLGGEYQGRKLGTESDAAIITFGIEKVLSAVRGGLAVTKDKELAEKLRMFQQSLPKFPWKRIYLSLLNPMFWSIFTPVYYLGIGKLTVGRIAAGLGHLFGLLGNMIESAEYEGEKPKWLPAQLPGALARLALNQWQKLERFNMHRRQIAGIYSKQLGIKFPEETGNKNVYLRFPVLVRNPRGLFNDAKKAHVILGDWYKSILYASEASWKKLFYQKGSSKVSEKIVKRIVNLPTAINVSQEDAERIAAITKKYL